MDTRVACCLLIVIVAVGIAGASHYYNPYRNFYTNFFGNGYGGASQYYPKPAPHRPAPRLYYSPRTQPAAPFNKRVPVRQRLPARRPTYQVRPHYHVPTTQAPHRPAPTPKRPAPAQAPHASQWSNWGPWGKCTVGCGSGWASRSRNCRTGGPGKDMAGCYGAHVESRACTGSYECGK